MTENLKAAALAANLQGQSKKQVDDLVASLQKTPNLNKTAVAAILNDIIMALGLNRTQITMYMNMIKQQRQKYNF